jgi:hypothetical protein
MLETSGLEQLKGKVALRVIKHYTVKYWYEGVDIQLHGFLTSARGRTEWSALGKGLPVLLVRMLNHYTS